MKNITTLLILISSVAMYAQKQYKSIDKGLCNVEHKCRMKVAYDEFNEIKTYEVGFYETHLGAKKTLPYILSKNIGSDNTETYILLLFGNKEGCNTEASKVIFLMTDKTKIEFKTASKKIRCGTSVISIFIDDLSLFLDNEIEKIRLSIEYNEDFETNQKSLQKFKNNLRCIMNLK